MQQTNKTSVSKVSQEAFPKKIILTLATLILAAIGFTLVGLYWDYMSDHNNFLNFNLTDNISIDLYGAIIPLTCGIVSALTYFLRKFSKKRFGLCFAVSLISAAAIFRLTDEGLMGSPLVFAILSSTAATLIIFLSKPLADAKGKLFASVLAALSCVPISLLLVDLAYTPLFVGATIGGNGLADAVLISTLYAPAWAALIAAILTLLIHTASFLRHARNGTLIAAP
jgi:hypothetical protein